jgi:hypothetical protein
MKRYCAVIGLMFFIFQQAIWAEDLPDDTTWQEKTVSHKTTGKTYFRGRPLPECKSFWILEEHIDYRMAGSTANQGNSDYSVSFDIGHMFNISRRHSLGSTFYIVGDHNRSYLGLQLRHRYWITQHLAWDLSAGTIIGSDDNHMYNGRIKFPSLLVSTFLNYDDWIAFHLSFEALKIRAEKPFQCNRNVTSLYGGVTLSSYPAVAVIAVTILITIFDNDEVIVF